MNIFPKVSVVAALLLAPVFSAQAEVECESGPKSQWMSKESVTKTLKEEGYEIRKVEVEDGCYEVYAMKDGKKLEIFINPKNGNVVDTKQK
ncbi:MAG: PepSY domain-containing protein [Alphaproteobacteria bacterium]|nr:PepSY domain-containing protein [Alphaproteobacteria bacterium]